ncbi:EAL domain-containing protein [Paucibacter soli]|uniref:EAL domain-containing protein n=1 Tax=Paucibacter soli TaxID=3133433 RepID=UPI0030AE6233
MDTFTTTQGERRRQRADVGLLSTLGWLLPQGVGRKLLLGLMLVLSAIAVPLWFQLRLSQTLLADTQQERVGARDGRQLLELLRLTQQIRLAKARSDDSRQPPPAPQRAWAELRQAAQLLSNQYQHALGWQAQLHAGATQYAVALQQTSLADRQPLTALDQRALEMLDQVVEGSGLILDPQADTYFLMTAALPTSARLMAALGVLADAAEPQERRARALAEARLLQDELRKSYGKVFAANQALREALEPGLRELGKLLAVALDPEPQRHADALNMAGSALHDLAVQALRWLDQRLEARAQVLRNSRYVEFASLAVLLAWLAALIRPIAMEYGQRTLALEHRAKLLSHAEDLAELGCAETDLMSDTVTWTTGMYKLFGEPVGNAPIDHDWLYLRLPKHERDFVRQSTQGQDPGAPCEFEHQILRADGSLRTVLHQRLVELDSKGWPKRELTILQDISRQREAAQRIDKLANSCTITGLPNRNALLHRLESATRRCLREQGSLALLMLQIEQLGIVMDSMGYAGADRLLTEVAARLSRAAQARAWLAHLGNGEFAFILGAATEQPGPIDIEAASAFAQCLCEAVATPMLLGDIEVKPSCCVGLTMCPTDGDNAPKLLHQAQAALKRAQQAGEQQIRAFDAASHARAASRLSIEAGLRRALERQAFSLRFQPQLDLATGLVCGAEVLLRWHDAVRGEVSPLEFIPIAEATGQIVEIGAWVLRQACLQNLAWQREGLRPIRLAVNLSMRQLQEPDIAWRVQEVLRETGMDPKYLGLEITESIFVDESAHATRALTALKAIGVTISLDDFGTGYSNLGYLRKLPIDIVKIDRSVVHDVAAAAHDVSMTRAVINMAHSLQMKVLAEGVETEGQLALLMANRCDEMQGFYFSPPVEADAFEQLLRAERRLPAHLFERERARTLLLVDDEENILAALKRLLRRDGYQIVTATSGAQGLQRLTEHSVDVILSDQRMPGMTGVEFLRRAKELYPDTVRMVLSGYTELQSITDAVNEGAIYKFLTKPWDDERLRGHISEAFRNKEMADENIRLGGAVAKANDELAQVNERLQALLQVQRERITREEVSLQTMRELLESIPVPIVGADPGGMITYVNAEADALFGGLPLGHAIDLMLPPDLSALWHAGEAQPTKFSLGGNDFLARCCTIGPGRDQASARGKLIVLMPVPHFAEEC